MLDLIHWGNDRLLSAHPGVHASVCETSRAGFRSPSLRTLYEALTRSLRL